jgi:membrane protein DedA with SNARE-associated domain
VDLAALISTYGYWAVAAGCLLEGETILALAGFAAHQGYLRLIDVIAVAAVAAFAGDQLFFWLGRRHGSVLLQRWPHLSDRAEWLHARLERYHALVIIGVRFAYGLRIAGPVLLGMMPICPRRFALFNAIGAVLWATLIAGLGWSFGRVFETVLGDLSRIEMWLLLALAGIGFAAWWWRRRRSRR